MRHLFQNALPKPNLDVANSILYNAIYSNIEHDTHLKAENGSYWVGLYDLTLFMVGLVFLSQA